MNEDVVIIEIACPQDRLSLYNKLMLLYCKYGEEALKDCQATCSKVSKNVITCWNMFTAACLIYSKDIVNEPSEADIKKSNLIFNFIESQVNLIYKDPEVYASQNNGTSNDSSTGEA